MTAADGLQVRVARAGDMASVQAIYAHHVLHGLASFEETPPDVDEMRRRFDEVCARGLPYLIAERDGVPAGYAYCAPYRLRSAYRFTVEDSVYVGHAHVRAGVGGALLDALIAESARQGYRQMVAVIGDSGHAGSIGLHRSRGFLLAGNLRSVGFKFGRWVDSVLMQRPLGGADGSQPQEIAALARDPR